MKKKFDTHSTANLPPLAILENLKFLRKKPLSFKTPQSFKALRNPSNLVAFYGKVAIIRWLKIIKLKTGPYERSFLGLSTWFEGPIGRELHFGLKNVSGTIPHWVPVFHVIARGVHATDPESVRTCGYNRNSSNIDRAPKMGESVLLNSWDSF